MVRSRQLLRFLRFGLLQVFFQYENISMHSLGHANPLTGETAATSYYCYARGDTDVDVTCPADHQIIVTDVTLLVKLKDTCDTAEATCCTRNNADCAVPSPDTDVQEKCNGKAICAQGALSQYATPATCTPADTYRASVGVVEIMSYCVNASSRIKLLDKTYSVTQTNSDWFYIQNANYGVGESILPDFSSVTCSVETDACEDGAIDFARVHFSLQLRNSACEQSLTITDVAGNSTSYGCDNNTDYSITVDTFTANYLTVKFDNNITTTSGGKLWVGFRATNPNANLTVVCPHREKTVCAPTTTTTSTTSTTTSTTTTPTTTSTTTTPTTTSTTTTPTTTTSTTTTPTTTSTTTTPTTTSTTTTPTTTSTTTTPTSTSTTTTPIATSTTTTPIATSTTPTTTSTVAKAVTTTTTTTLRTTKTTTSSSPINTGVIIAIAMAIGAVFLSILIIVAVCVRKRSSSKPAIKDEIEDITRPTVQQIYTTGDAKDELVTEHENDELRKDILHSTHSKSSQGSMSSEHADDKQDTEDNRSVSSEQSNSTDDTEYSRTMSSEHTNNTDDSQDSRTVSSEQTSSTQDTSESHSISNSPETQSEQLEDSEETDGNTESVNNNGKQREQSPENNSGSENGHFIAQEIPNGQELPSNDENNESEETAICNSQEKIDNQKKENKTSTPIRVKRGNGYKNGKGRSSTLKPAVVEFTANTYQRSQPPIQGDETNIRGSNEHRVRNKDGRQSKPFMRLRNRLLKRRAKSAKPRFKPPEQRPPSTIPRSQSANPRRRSTETRNRRTESRSSRSALRRGKSLTPVDDDRMGWMSRSVSREWSHLFCQTYLAHHDPSYRRDLTHHDPSYRSTMSSTQPYQEIT